MRHLLTHLVYSSSSVIQRVRGQSIVVDYQRRPQDLLQKLRQPGGGGGAAARRHAAIEGMGVSGVALITPASSTPSTSFTLSLACLLAFPNYLATTYNMFILPSSYWLVLLVFILITNTGWLRSTTRNQLSVQYGNSI